MATNLLDMLNHHPDILADEKINAVMSDIYDNLIEFTNKSDYKKIVDLIDTLGLECFIDWFITNIYMPETDDIKIVAYISSNTNEIIGILAQAISNITPKDAIENLEEDKLMDSDDVVDNNEEILDKLEDPNGDEQIEQIAKPDIRSILSQNIDKMIGKES